MLSLSKTLFCFVGLCFSALIATMSLSPLNSRELSNTRGPSKIAQASDDSDYSYRFKNPRLAYKVLTQLDVFKPLDDSYFNDRYNRTNRYNESFMGLTNEDDYCDKHRLYITSFPEAIFEETNFMTQFEASSFLRKKIGQTMGNDIMPYLGYHTAKSIRDSKKYDVPLQANIFHTTDAMHPFKHIGLHFSCLSQAYNHIPGNKILSTKDLVAKAITKYANKYADRPQCFTYDKYFPQNWVLYEKDECEAFFKELNSPAYEQLKKDRRIVYIRKVGASSHGGKGVQPVNEEEEAYLRKLYNNGAKCGKVNQNYLVQNFIHNPLLLNGHKFDFRMFMLVASTNPVIAYYHDGWLRVTLQEYDINSDDKKTLLTNIGLNSEIYQSARQGNLYKGIMDEEAIKQAQEWTLERLQNHLISEGRIEDPNWLDNYLRPEFRKAMTHIVRLISHAYVRRSTVYELYGMDFMLDDNLNLWFVEANAGPAFPEFSQPIKKFVIKMFEDHFEIIMGLLRSRMKRVVHYVNELLDTGVAIEKEKGEVSITNIKTRRAVFENITKNYFEKEYEPSPNSGFYKIIDENLQGVDRYQGFISQECL